VARRGQIPNAYRGMIDGSSLIRPCGPTALIS
jgi:hypothetical protein